MRSLLALFEELPWPIAGGWILFLTWAAMQAVWYRRARIASPVAAHAPASARTAAARPVRRKKTETTTVDALPSIELDSIANAHVAPPSQTVLGL